jgi:DNA-directed RNA polymerase subunit beta
MVLVRALSPDGRRLPATVKDYSRIPDALELPDLVLIQKQSYRWFLEEGLQELLDEISPVQDYTGGRLELRFEKEVFPLTDSPEEMEGEVPLQDVYDREGRLIAAAGQPLTREQAQALKEAREEPLPVRPYRLDRPKFSEEECREKDLTYSAPLRLNVRLWVKETGEIKEQQIFLGEMPLMTPRGTFIVNGAERVVVSQLVRSPGAYFTLERDQTSGRLLCYAKLIPNRGAWLEFETTARDVIYVKVDRRRKLPVTILLRACFEKEGVHSDDALGTNEQLLELFADVDSDPVHQYIRATLERDTGCRNKKEAITEFYKRMRPGDPPTGENARRLLNDLFFNPRRYDLSRVGRYKLNRRLGLQEELSKRVLTFRDLVALVREMIRLNNGQGQPDDIDHLGNRRVRTVGELIQNALRIGFLRMERGIRDRMSITEVAQAAPAGLINVRPVQAAIREFFGSSQLSQFMDQTNPLAELTHKRRLSALGPGGLSRDRAGFEVRDVHPSHYGRICPIETPEGPNIGLIGSLATYGKVNQFGFIETPYRRVFKELPKDSPLLVGRVLREEVRDGEGQLIAPAGAEVTPELAQRLAALPAGTTLKVRPFVSDQVEYLSADAEEGHVIAQANSPVDSRGHFLEERLEARKGGHFIAARPEEVDYVDLTPKQTVSVAASLIPFLEHDDAGRALMGANMQRQAVPLVRPEAPLVATGMERRAAADSGQIVVAEGDGWVKSVQGDAITVLYDDGREKTYRLFKFLRSNQGTCLNQRPVVRKGQRVRRGDPLADSCSTDGGELALGQNLLVAFMAWEGYNFEDAIIISEAVVRDDRFTSIHIEEYELEARDTKLGPEEITRDIPNVGEESLKDLDEWGVVRIGAEVRAGDILVGKITPKGETELSAEEKLLRAIFGEKAREVKDTSLRMPHGEWGRVIDTRFFARPDPGHGQEGHQCRWPAYAEITENLSVGVNAKVRVFVAQRRPITVGDKMAGRHGNKGVIARILPVEDMPHLPDGTPVDIVLNPIGVPSRMNIGQVLETHLGWAAMRLGFRAISPVFDGGNPQTIEDALCRAWLVEQAGALLPYPSAQPNPVGERVDYQRACRWLRQQGYDPDQVFADDQLGAAKRAALELWLEQQGEKGVRGRPLQELEARAEELLLQRGVAAPTYGRQVLIDGRTGEPFDQPVTVGYIYMMKLIHLVEDKIHARSTGPYSLITQQPLGGKAQFGGQRFGEMEVWALEAYGAAHTLQEMLTIKSDDVVGRQKAYEAIVKGDDIQERGVPESFKVLMRELQSLCLSVQPLREEEPVALPETATADLPRLGIDLRGFEKGEDLLGD